MCIEGKVKSVKKVQKIRNDANGWEGAEVKYVNSKGEEKGVGFTDYKKNFEENCSECGRKNFKCKINRAEDNNNPETDSQTIEKQDVTSEVLK